MKKKLLLLVIAVIAIISVFAISASADVIYKDADGAELFRYVDEDNNYDFDSYSGAFPKFDSNNNALTWYITATATDGDDTVYTVESKITLGEAGSINDNGAYSFTSPVTNKNTVSVNFPDNAGIKTWAFSTFGGYNSRANNNVLFVYCPNTLTEFANNPFQETQVIVVELDDETPITSIPQNFCHEARNLEAINIPSSVTVINGNSGKMGAPFYNNCSLTKVTFASDDTLVELKNACFHKCSSLVSIELPQSVTTMGDYVFASCTSLKEISLPNSLITVKNHFLAWCSSLEVIRMGDSFEYFSNSSNDHNSFAYSTKVKEIYIPKTFYATVPTTTYKVSYAFDGATSDCKFFYCGTVDEFEIAKSNFLTQTSATTNNSKFINATVITYAEYLANPDDYATGNYVICEYNTCKAFYNDVHKGDDGDCTTADTCARCNTTFEAKESHNITVNTLVYANGLGSTGVRNYICDNEGCYAVDEINKEYEAIIGAKGYSFKENDKTGLDGGYSINTKLLALYEELNGSVKIGIIIVNAEDAQKNGLVDESFELISTKGMKVEMSSREYSYFDLKITGFNTEKLQNLGLIITSYVIDDFDGDGTEEIKYVQHKMSDANESPVTIGGVVYNTVTVERAYKEKYPTEA